MKNDKKIIETSKINNIRDLGGNRTNNNQFIKNNLFIRCAVPKNLGKNDKDILIDLDPGAIIDFRGVEEAKKNPPDLTKKLEKKRVHLPIEPEVWDTLNKLNSFNNLNEESFQETLKEAYRKYTKDHLDVYKEFFRILFKLVGKPVIFHCTAGKDRTGFAGALILLMLNVGQEDVFSDYLMSNKKFKPPANIKKEVSLIGANRLVKVDKEWLDAGLKQFSDQVGKLHDFGASLIGSNENMEKYIKACLIR